ncbi:autotransporter outer membrane beta-barrel domain-containing protein [Pseudomonas putida]
MQCHPSSAGKYTVLALAIASASTLMLFSPLAQAQSVVVDTTLDASTPVDRYQVFGVQLTANGAWTQEIQAETGSALHLNGAHVTASAGAMGVSLFGSTATVRDSDITSPRNQGLLASSGSQVDIFDSRISGTLNGATISASTANIDHTELTGTKGNGAVLIAGTLNASNQSVIRGGLNGISITNGRSPTTGSATLVLDNTTVIGESGAAIAVSGSSAGGSGTASSSIDIRNGTSLSAGNGSLVAVAADGDASVRVDNSHLLGDIIVEQGGRADITLDNSATLQGRLENTERLTLANQAEWTMLGDSQLNQLAMSGGAINLGVAPGDFHTLTVSSLEGSGTFKMDVDFATGEADRLDVTGTATGNHQLLVSSSGSDPQAESSLQLVHAAAGDASFALQGGPVDLGAYSYDLVQHENDWYLDTATRTVSPSTQTMLGLFNSAPTVWYGELATLRSRMGEVRRDNGKAGGWVRTYGNKFNVSSSAGTAYQQTQQGISFGVDKPLAIGDGNWLAGVTGGYSKSDLDLARGASGDVDSYHVGAYATWLQPQSGYYADIVGKLNRYRNEADVQLSDGQRTQGNYDTHGAGLSVELGRHIKLADDYFIEPFGQLAGMVVQGKDVTHDNGMHAQGDPARSLQAKLGATAGRNLNFGQGRSVQPYLKLAAVHEFANDNEVNVNGNRFANDLSGSRAELGAGVSVAWAERWQVHTDVDYSHGKKIEQPWGVSLGLRYNW